MERNRIIQIGVTAGVLLIGMIIFLGMRKPKGPDCALISKAQTQQGRPVAALAPLLGDDPKGMQADLVAKAMASLVDVARVPMPTPNFAKLSAPEAIQDAEKLSQAWLKCGASAVVWGTVEHEGEQVIEEKKSRGKTTVTKPIYGLLLWVTSGPEATRQIPRTRDGREAGEAVFRAASEKATSKPSDSPPQTSSQPNQDAPPPAQTQPVSQEKP
jgi:hypothetical protein